MSIFIEVLKINLYMSIVILLVFISKKKLLGKYTAKFNYILYMGILLRLVCFIKLKISLPSSPSIEKYTYNSNGLNYINYVNYTIKDTVKSLNVIDILYYIWIIVSIVGIIYFACYQIKFYKGIRCLQEEILHENIISILENQKKSLKIKRNIKVYKLDGIYSPMLIGVLNPKIILSNKHYENEELHFIFKHELIHYKRKDNLWKVLIALVNIIYWFNPVIYIFRKSFNEQCELSCDELVVKKSSIDEIKSYSLMLLETVKYKNKLNASMCASQFNLNKSNIIKIRIEKILSLKSRKKGLIIGLFLCILSSLSLVSFSIKEDVKETKKQFGKESYVGYKELSEYIKIDKDPEKMTKEELRQLKQKSQEYELRKQGITKNISELTSEEKKQIITGMINSAEEEFKEKYDVESMKKEYNYLEVRLEDGSFISTSINEEQFFEDCSKE